MDSPSLNGSKRSRPGRSRFAAGNPGGHSSPLAKKANQLQAAVSKAISTADVKVKIATKMVDLAKGGDIQAAKLVFDRVLGADCRSGHYRSHRAARGSDGAAGTADMTIDKGRLRKLEAALARRPDIEPDLPAKVAAMMADPVELAANLILTTFSCPCLTDKEPKTWQTSFGGNLDRPWYQEATAALLQNPAVRAALLHMRREDLDWSGQLAGNRWRHGMTNGANLDQVECASANASECV